MRPSGIGGTGFPIATSDPSIRWLLEAVVDLQRASHEQNEIIGPAGATDGALVLFDGDSGTLAKEMGSGDLDDVRESLGFSVSDPSGFLPGQIIQEVVATRSTTDATTSDSFVNTGLSASITPLLDNSIIEAEARVPWGTIAAINNHVSRTGYFRIRNTTDGVNGNENRVGRNMASASAVSAASSGLPSTFMRYAVNSTSARTFLLQFRVNNPTDIEISTQAATSEISMILREIKQ